MPGRFNPENDTGIYSIGAERRNWIHERAQLDNLTDTQYLIKIIDDFKEVIKHNAK